MDLITANDECLGMMNIDFHLLAYHYASHPPWFMYLKISLESAGRKAYFKLLVATVEDITPRGDSKTAVTDRQLYNLNSNSLIYSELAFLCIRSSQRRLVLLLWFMSAP